MHERTLQIAIFFYKCEHDSYCLKKHHVVAWKEFFMPPHILTQILFVHLSKKIWFLFRDFISRDIKITPRKLVRTVRKSQAVVERWRINLRKKIEREKFLNKICLSSVCFACMYICNYVRCMCALLWDQNRILDPLKPELRMGVNPHMGSGNWTPSLCKC